MSKSLTYLNPTKYAAYVDDLVERAKDLLEQNEYEMTTQAWYQDWSDSTCGFPGKGGGQAITRAMTVVFELYPLMPDNTRIHFYVYHAGKFAYHLKDDYIDDLLDDEFYEHLRTRRMRGADTYELYKLNRPKPHQHKMCTCHECQCGDNATELTAIEKAEAVFRHEFCDEAIQIVKDGIRVDMTFEQALDWALQEMERRTTHENDKPAPVPSD